MAKGLRLKFRGHHLEREDIEMLASCLGRNTYPQYNGWGVAGCRNYLAFESGKSFDRCERLVSAGIMGKEKNPLQRYTYFYCTDLGRCIFELFRRHHKRPRLHLDKGHRRSK